MLVEGGAFSATGEPLCMEPGCTKRAMCLPRLWVPARPILLTTLRRPFDGVASTMGLPLCFQHFYNLRPRDLLKDAEVRESIEKDFRAKGAIPWWDRAALYMVRRREPDFDRVIAEFKRLRATA